MSTNEDVVALLSAWIYHKTSQMIFRDGSLNKITQFREAINNESHKIFSVFIANLKNESPFNCTEPVINKIYREFLTPR